MEPSSIYADLMGVIRSRLDSIAVLKETQPNKFTSAEGAAFHGRKIIEGVAFGCLVILDHGIKHIPSDAKGQWNAEKILQSLISKRLDVLPSPSVIRPPDTKEMEVYNTRFVVQGVPEFRLSANELLSIYRRLHPWLHEINPYVNGNKQNYLDKEGPTLWSDLSKLNNFLDTHFISIRGQGLLCVLRDKLDGMTKVVPLNKIGELLPD